MSGDCAAIPTRLRVQARQIYVFCELGRLGWKGTWRDCVERGIEHLLAKGRRDNGFFIHTFGADGAPLDLRADLYDHAFVLLALAHAARALQKSDLLDIADATMDLIEARWKSPHGGYLEGEVDGPPRRQNPHMHLLEASLALWEISASARWKEIARELGLLCQQKFVDPATGALMEYFAGDWSRQPGSEGLRVEPGHCFEWSWLFERLTSLDILDGAKMSDGLAQFARSTGIDQERGVAINAVNLSGQIEDGDARLWPQTERLKSTVVRSRRRGGALEVHEAEAALRGLQSYLLVPMKGLWRDVLRADGIWVEQPAPASSFYHIVCGLSELIG